ncbi:MAG TPA: AzlC family ABC transporter permease [Actinomycetes bacterium]|nr:AzlC family ABC transporter permease [Actinomycetes bacterium]
MTESWPEARARLVRTAVSIGVASGAYGISLGALGVAAGLSVTQTCAMSLLVFTGGSQFALVGVIGGGGAAASGAASAILLGVRNGVYGVRLAPLLRLRGPRRFVGAQLVIDESTAVGLSGETVGGGLGTRAGRLGFWATGLAVFVLWNLATLVGAIAGDAVGDPRTFGLDAAAPAAFLALLAPRLDNRPAWVIAVVSAVVAVSVVPLVPAGVPVLVAALVPVVAVLARRTRPASERETT